jgi:hypothetical protein
MQCYLIFTKYRSEANTLAFCSEHIEQTFHIRQYQYALPVSLSKQVRYGTVSPQY